MPALPSQLKIYPSNAVVLVVMVCKLVKNSRVGRTTPNKSWKQTNKQLTLNIMYSSFTLITSDKKHGRCVKHKYGISPRVLTAK